MERHVNRCRGVADKSWALVAAISQLAAMAQDFGDWEIIALAAVLSGLLLGASEAYTVKITTPTSDDDLPAAEFWGSKSRRGKNASHVGPCVRK